MVFTVWWDTDLLPVVVIAVVANLVGHRQRRRYRATLEANGWKLNPQP
jgi:hypothetical protein